MVARAFSIHLIVADLQTQPKGQFGMNPAGTVGAP
jgi:hypothetical protein